jgi:dipeptidyl aminopeptidase/acylaminoacyl peptidase
LQNRALLLCLALCLGACIAAAANAEPRLLSPDDYYQLVDLTDPQVAPDGSQVAYVVTESDRTADARKDSIWIVAWDGSQRRRLTGTDSANTPRFSPDGRYLSFLSERPADSPAQIWVLDLHGGEARQLTHTNGDISTYAWSPDGKRMVVVTAKGDQPAVKTPQPMVIQDYHFKADEEGYLTAANHRHLYLVDVDSGAQSTLTTAAEFDDGGAIWSPDGTLLAYVSNHDKEPDRTGRDEIYLIEPHQGATPRKLATVYSPNSQHLAFSADGKSLSLLQGREPKYNAYIADRLAVLALSDGSIRPLSDKLDQQVSSPSLNADGTIDFIVEDSGLAYVSRIDVGTGKIERRSPQNITALHIASGKGHNVMVGTTDTVAPELFAIEDGRARRLTTQNEAALADVKLGSVEDIHFKSRDGTEIQGQLIKPPSYIAGHRYPTLLWIHGGPNGQDQHELINSGYSPSLERQLFAAQGYVVLGINYRGSTGRGKAFQESIQADWGHKEVEDLLAGVDYAVAKGVADPAKLGIGGWSYGGILTDYTIASDTRFKAAISGAGSGDQSGMYGLDQYALQWNNEIGAPWKNTALYLKISYPFFHADRIHTPTLFMGGDKDFNVPIAGSEQMYFALRTLRVPSELVVYPGEFHVFTRPSFLKDRADRYIAWYAKYLKATS